MEVDRIDLGSEILKTKTDCDENGDPDALPLIENNPSKNDREKVESEERIKKSAGDQQGDCENQNVQENLLKGGGGQMGALFDFLRVKAVVKEGEARQKSQQMQRDFYAENIAAGDGGENHAECGETAYAGQPDQALPQYAAFFSIGARMNFAHRL